LYTDLAGSQCVKRISSKAHRFGPQFHALP
jgi:hypothetical protein